MGVVRIIARQSTHHTYTIEDGTGSIDGRKFPSEGEDSSDMNAIAYVEADARDAWEECFKHD